MAFSNRKLTAILKKQVAVCSMWRWTQRSLKIIAFFKQILIARLLIPVVSVLNDLDAVNTNYSTSTNIKIRIRIC